jgi:hypothetical protein
VGQPLVEALAGRIGQQLDALNPADLEERLDEPPAC